MEKKQIIEINEEKINKENYYDKFSKALDFIETMRNVTDENINFSIYNFIARPDFDTLDDLNTNLRLKSLLNCEVADAIGTAYRTGRLDWDQEKYDRIFKKEEPADAGEYIWKKAMQESEENGKDFSEVLLKKVLTLDE